MKSPFSNAMVTTAAIVVVIAGMKMAESLLVPFLLSVFIALILSPVMNWLKSKGIPAAIAIGLVVLVVILLNWLLGLLVGSSISDFRQNLPEYQERLYSVGKSFAEWMSSKGIKLDPEQLRDRFDPAIFMHLAGNTMSSFGNVMANAFLILLTVVFILAEEDSFTDRLKRNRVGSEVTSESLERFAESVNSYMAIKTLLSLLTGVLVVIWLLILGVDYPVMWGLLAFVLNFVPNVGSIIAAVPVVLLALIQLGPLHAGLTAAGYVVVNVGVGNMLEPRWMGSGLNLSPLVVFLSLVFWGWVLGPVGMLLSIPLTIMAKIALENQPETRWIGQMLGSGVKPEAKPEPESSE